MPLFPEDDDSSEAARASSFLPFFASCISPRIGDAFMPKLTSILPFFAPLVSPRIGCKLDVDPVSIA